MSWRRPIATIDAETDPFSKSRALDDLLPQPFIWGFYDGGFMDPDKPFYHFEETEELIEFIRDKEFIIYAHNGGKFDYHYLKDYAEDFDEITAINGRISRMHIGIAELRDSWNILPVPLAMYQKQDQDYSIHEYTERKKPENWARIVDYLRSDCENLFAVVSAYRERFGFNLTQAAGSMKEMNKKTAMPLPQTRYPDFYDTYHPFYFGGRVECFQAGILNKNFKVVDINSAYPFAMLHKHPYSYDMHVEQGDYRDQLSPEEITAAFYKVRCVSRGALPWRDPTGQLEDGSLHFPNDDIPREFHITGWELVAGLETGTISDLEVIETHASDEITDFKSFILDLYNERLDAKARNDKAGDLLAKLAMNACYGRFAMDSRNYQDYMLLPPEKVGWLHPDNESQWMDLEGRVWYFYGWFGNHALAASPIPEEKWRFYHVGTAASITGFVRAMLWRAICASDTPLYCDTDSIAAADVPVTLGKELGEWEIEGEFDQAYIAGKKLYAFRYARHNIPKGKNGKKKRYKVASKGVKLSPAEIRRVARGETVTYVPESPTYRLSGFVNRETGEKQIARYIKRNVAMLNRTKSRVAK